MYSKLLVFVIYIDVHLSDDLFNHEGRKGLFYDLATVFLERLLATD